VVLARDDVGMMMTKQERGRLPARLLVTWCVFCEKPDYAFVKATDIETRTCPYCDHQHEVVRVFVEK
jgi:hypothetical protein